MPDFSTVGPEHVRAAMAECDRLGNKEFLARYHFGRAYATTLWQRGREYDCQAILGLAYLNATGRAVTRQDLASGSDDAGQVLERLGFDVVVDEELAAQTPAPRASAPRATPAARAPRKAAAKPAPRKVAVERVPTICPHCCLAIPATGICDNCG